MNHYHESCYGLYEHERVEYWQAEVERLKQELDKARKCCHELPEAGVPWDHVAGDEQVVNSADALERAERAEAQVAALREALVSPAVARRLLSWTVYRFTFGKRWKG